MDEIQEKVLNELVDKYEKSKTFTGDNKTNQSFSIDVGKKFPLYMDSSAYEFHKRIDASLESLEKKNFISITKKKNHVIEKCFLKMESLENIYSFLNRQSRKDIQNRLKILLESINAEKESPLFNFIEAQKNHIERNQEVEFFKNNFSDFEDLLKAVETVQKNNSETLIRVLSVLIFNNSKKLESIKNEVQSILFKYGDYESKETVFSECGVMKTPTTVKIKGNAIIEIAGQKLDLSKIEGDIEFSTKTLKVLNSIEVLGTSVVSIENLTSFYEYENNDDFQIYLGGFHNTTKRDFLKKVFNQNPQKKYFHFGDIDAGGFYILEHLSEKTGIPFSPLNMDIKTLEQNKINWIALTENDRKRLVDLKSKTNRFNEVIDFMIENNCKLEQESEI